MLQRLKKQRVMFGDGSQAEIRESKFENKKYEITFVQNSKETTQKFSEEDIFFLDTDESGITLWLVDCFADGRKTDVIRRINKHFEERLN